MRPYKESIPTHFFKFTAYEQSVPLWWCHYPVHELCEIKETFSGSCYPSSMMTSYFSILLSHPVWLYGCYLSWKPVWLFEIIVNHFLTDSRICNTITIINDKWEQPSDWTLKAILWYPEVINTVAWAVAILFSFKFTVMLTGIIYRKCGYRFEIFAGANTIISFN